MVADLVPAVAVGDELAAAFPVGDGRVLQIRPEVARDVVARELRAKGWRVDEVVAYRTVSATLDDATRARVRDADAVTFTSSSTVDNLVALVGVDGLPTVTVSIGPITSSTLEAHGIAPTTEAAPHTIDGLVDRRRQRTRPSLTNQHFRTGWGSGRSSDRKPTRFGRHPRFWVG